MVNQLKLNYTRANGIAPVILALLAFLLGTFHANAQIAFTAGGNISTIGHEIALKNVKPSFNTQVGFSLQLYPSGKWQRISVLAEPNLVRKGYRQTLDEKSYSFEFNYLSLPVLMNYSLSERISINSGLEFDKLFSTNIRQGMKTYNRFDVGIVAGINCHLSGRFSLYSRFAYGLVPLLDYYEIDELGNFKKELHDLKNRSLTVGIKFNLSNEKIRLYKQF
jgi:hypothetical protein